ncbi:MAG: DUF4062 domain-containing protein, partial [Proteobacteria bacterium]|nr:DUF4062 domain-containing protein [Pseudomonadota bacterium]
MQLQLHRYPLSASNRNPAATPEDSTQSHGTKHLRGDDGKGAALALDSAIRVRHTDPKGGPGSMSQIYRVFLSSTGKDLAGYRQKVFEALQRKPDVKVVRMEDFVAEHGKPKDICAREVRDSDILVGLIGFCYGASPPGLKRSFTHLEYDEAMAKGHSCLIHIAPEDVPFPAYTREPDALFQRITRFRAKLLKTHTVGHRSSWENADALATHVSEAVERALDRMRAAAEPGFTKRKHELGLKGRHADILALLAEEGAERDLLLAQKAEVERKLGDLEQSFAQAKTRITDLEALLAREGNQIGGDRLAEARAALEQGDFSKADDLFAEIEAREAMAVQSAARAAYGRGEIAEEQVRWADAAEHYG